MMMVRSRSSGAPGALSVGGILCAWAWLSALVLLASAPSAQAASFTDWVSKLTASAERKAPLKPFRGSFDNAVEHVKAMPASGGTVLAAEATREGHWRFVNRSGETFTAGTPEELKRAASVLFPGTKADAKLTLYVTEDTIFLYRAALNELPKGTELYVVVGRESYRILRRGDGDRLLAEVRPSLVVEMADRKLFEEAVWQLARPLNRAGMRVVALEAGGPPWIASSPRLDPATKRALTDVIDPASFAAALGSVRGQTVVITGRIDRELLVVKPSSGPERSLLLRDLFQAAEEADVNLLLLQSSSPRQPGGRNWLWQKVHVRGLDEGLDRAHVADVLNALAGPGRRLAVAATPMGGRRTVLDMAPAPDLPSAPTSSPIGDAFAGIVADLTGKVVATSMRASLRSAERQQELDQRLLPGIPSGFQLGYVLLVMLGLLGVPVSRAWWRAIWPPENAQEYASRSGFWAARVVRSLAFLLLFLPLTAPVSAPYSLARQIYDAVTAPVRWWRWLTGRRTAAAS
jgi:hypothetical protein